MTFLMLLSLILLTTAMWKSCLGAECSNQLGMSSGLINDDQITASSFYGAHLPKYARLNGNSSWCAQKNYSSGTFLEIDLGRIMRLTALAIQGYDGRYVSKYTIQYKRRKSNKYWRVMIERLPDNTTKIWSFYGIRKNTTRSRYTTLKGPRVARYIRIIPLEGVGKYWCLRAELYGCEWEKKDGLLSYRSAQGNIRGMNETKVVMKDATYDGAANFLGRRQGILQGGLGQLSDGVIGGNAFWYDLASGKGFEWVGWFDVEIPKPSILFEFDAPRTFQKILFYVNNRPGNVKIFRNLLVSFSTDGQYFSRKFVFYPDAAIRKKDTQSMWVEVDLAGHVGKYLNCEFTYEGKWIVLSEISFVSAPATDQRTTKTPKLFTRWITPKAASTSLSPVERGLAGRKSLLSMPVIIALAIVGFILIILTIVLVLWLKSRRSRVENRTTLQQLNSVRIVNPLKDDSVVKKAPSSSYSSDSDDDVEHLVANKMNNCVPKQQPWYKSLDRYKMSNISVGLKAWKANKYGEGEDDDELEKVKL